MWTKKYKQNMERRGQMYKFVQNVSISSKDSVSCSSDTCKMDILFDNFRHKLR